MSDPRAWLTRAGKYGERDAWALDSNVTPGGFGNVGDLSECASLEDVRALVAQAEPNASANAITNYAAQLWALVGRMSEGDYVVLPRKATKQLAIGKIAGPYEYSASEDDPERRHLRPVEWLRKDVPRGSIKQDLLHSLGAFSTYCQVSRNDSVQRIAAIAAHGRDPGSGSSAARVDKGTKKKGRGSSEAEVPDVPDADEGPRDLEQSAQDQIVALVQENFAGHRMAVLVEVLLRAEGYTCWRSPEGTDGGIDILAGSGPLGLDAPQLVVQVKSEQSPVGDPVVTQLLGSTTKQGPAAQGLLVAWGGLTPPARKSARDNYFRLRIWESDDIITRLTRHYTSLPEEIRADLPLKQIWIAVEDNS